MMPRLCRVTDDRRQAKNPLGPTGDRVIANIKHLRQSQGLTYKQLSERLEELGRPIPVLGLSRLERGERRVDVDDLMALAVALGVTPNRLLLFPSTGFKDPGAKLDLTHGIRPRIDDAWAWAYGERPLGKPPTSFADMPHDDALGDAASNPAIDEMRFVAENRGYYAVGGFDWLLRAWLHGKDPAELKNELKNLKVDLRVEGSGMIASAILGAFTRYGLNTRDVRSAVESGIIASLVSEEPDDDEFGIEQVLDWLMSSQAEREAGPGTHDGAPGDD
jgi:transcriptional regulator with XRE-family HTH domain